MGNVDPNLAVTSVGFWAFEIDRIRLILFAALPDFAHFYAPLSFLADYRGYLQADAYPGYDPLFVDGKITEVACNVHARRKFVEAADLLKTPGRPLLVRLKPRL
jgi:hypothetical protein